MGMPLYRAITDQIEVCVEPTYLPEHSSPDALYYFFSYEVTVINHRPENVQLMTRHWIITDGQRRTHEVEGDGVVGVQPTIKSKESFTYSSFCPLPTATGNMRGQYTLKKLNGEMFNVEIPLFFLRDFEHESKLH
jgi:ApaG protein